jgi:hypothetical protein
MIKEARWFWGSFGVFKNIYDNTPMHIFGTSLYRNFNVSRAENEDCALTPI